MSLSEWYPHLCIVDVKNNNLSGVGHVVNYTVSLYGGPLWGNYSMLEWAVTFFT